MRSAASKFALSMFAIILAVWGSLAAPGIIANVPMLTGTVRAANITITACSYSVSPRVLAFNRYGGTASLKVTTSGECQWSISTDQSWLRTDGPPIRTGPGTVTVSAGAADTQLTGLLSVAGEAVRVDVLPSTRPPSPAVLYLMEVFDRFQHTIDVYTDADAAGNMFAARGRISSSGPGHEDAVPPMDEVSKGAPCFAGTCITASLRSRGANWGGWYFMLGVLGEKDRQPTPNWGDSPKAGVDLSGATRLRFRVRGKNGGERVEFLAFGVGRDTGKPFPDSTPKQAFGELQLTTEWTTVEMSLSGLDLSYVVGGFGWSASAARNGNRDVTFYLDDIQFIKEHPDDLHLLLSYETLPYGSDFDIVSRNVAFTYDTAVAMIALASAGDMKRAQVLAKSLVYASQHDRYFGPGRVRNAYQAGSLVLPPGWLPNGKSDTARMPGWYNAARSNWFEDEFHVSAAVGNVAWTCLALLHMYEKDANPTLLTAIQQMADWLLANAQDGRGAGGFTGGFEGWEGGYAPGCPTGQYVEGQCKRLYKSTEHNIDLYSVFRRLYLIDGSEQWNAAARKARALVRSMWDQNERKFWTGTAEDGVTPFKDIIPADIQAWAIQAFGDESRPYWPGLEYAERRHAAAGGYGFKQNGGNSCGDWAWWEGTSQIGIAYAIAGNVAKRTSILKFVHDDQVRFADSPVAESSMPSRVVGAVRATNGPCLNTGFTLNDGQPWLYYPRAHVGASAWLVLLENNVNPFQPAQSPANVPTVKIDLPAAGTTIDGNVELVGWAIDNAAAVGTAIKSVAVYVDGIKVGDAQYGRLRREVCIAFPGRPGCPNVGFSLALDTSTLTPGEHELRVVATDSDSPTPRVGFAERTLNVPGAPAGLPPSVEITSPVEGTFVSDTVEISGWALDNADAAESAISKVEVLINGSKVGEADYGKARPEVCSKYTGRPGCPNVGFSYKWNTTTLPPGVHTIQLRVTDSDTPIPRTTTTAQRTVLVPARYRLHGLDFGPYVLPGQDPDLGSVVPEGQLRSLLTTIAPYTQWVRTFGMSGGLDKAGRIAHELGLRTAIGAWLNSDAASNEREIQAIIAAANRGDVDLAIVGSETLYRGDLTQSQLVEYIRRVKAAVPATVQVTTADTFDKLRNSASVIAAVDVLLVNYYPFWSGTHISTAVALVNSQHTQMVQVAGAKPVYVSETGWPSTGNRVGNAVPSPENAAYYLLNIASWARAKNIPIFYFEAFDEPWKAKHEGPQGAAWGIWTNTGQMKPGMKDTFDGKTIPDNWTLPMPGGPGKPAVEFTFVPALGKGPGSVAGQVWHVDPAKYRIALYILVGSGWWTKPYFAQPLTEIVPDGSWTSPIYTGGMDSAATKVAAFLVPAGYNPPVMSGGATLPADLFSTAAAHVEILRTPASISGRITDTTGAAVDGVHIVLNGTSPSTARTALGGYFSFPNLTAGAYSIVPAEGAYTFSPPSANVSVSRIGVEVNFTAVKR